MSGSAGVVGGCDHPRMSSMAVVVEPLPDFEDVYATALEVESGAVIVRPRAATVGAVLNLVVVEG